jgi:toxin ParE1/3/4
MEYAPRLTPQAQADIADACRHIAVELENPQAAINLANGIYDVICSLDFMPNRNPVWPREPWRSREVRWTAYKNYNIFYAVDDAKAMVKILRVFYNRRNV